MDVPFRELLDLLIRWVHLIAGIMWIGNSMLFNWLDRNLVKVSQREGHEGEIWLLHSGGFYQVEKKQLAPNEMPAILHWFKWQNGVTWLSGISLLVVVYYLGGGALMVDPTVSSLGASAATALGLGSIVGSWVVYDLIWRSPLGKKAPTVASALSFVALFAVSLGLTQLLSGRAAYMHVGVILGTLMTGNVWMVIIPSQRELVQATQEGRPQDYSIAMRAKQRSIHNNYMTFPLLFVMISNHYASTYGNKFNWAILFVLMISSALVRHFMNIRFTYARWLPAASAAVFFGLTGLFLLTARPEPKVSREPVSFAEAQAIVQSRCTTCHSASPTDEVWKTAPVGIVLDTPEAMIRLAPRIKERVLVQKTMPLANKTGMTDLEREKLGGWIAQGAKGP
ncbi:MAG: urate hydroxylase PuuD [Polyangiaceae bacterium]|nr:urate hydroxylase PuuD [Polyangiaceae bacterium]